MIRTIENTVDEWRICFRRNVHMYSHDLSVSKGQEKFGLDCEDLPTAEKTIGIWLHNSVIPSAKVGELQGVLLKWASTLEIRFQIYTSNHEFVSNK